MGVWGLVWTVIAAAAGCGLAAAVSTWLSRRVRAEVSEHDGGYNALAPFVDH